MTVLIAVWGVSPGIGKSTLCDRLSGRLAGAGRTVDHFAEDEIRTRTSYADVAAEFAANGTVALDTLLDATRRYVTSLAGIDVAVTDALMPYVPTLLAMGHSDEAIGSFAADLRDVLAPVRPVLVFLDGDPAAALRRAATRAGPAWLDWYVRKLARYRVQPEVFDLESAVRYLNRERTTTLALADVAGWPVVVVPDATARTAEAVFVEALARLTELDARLR
jgi:hypothetical protein